MGDDAFFRGIRDYYAHQTGGVVTSADFAAEMAAAAGAAGAANEELGWFFDQWLHEPGYPVLEVTHTWHAEAGEVGVTVRQVQDPAWPTFRLPMELEIGDSAGGTRRYPIELTERTHSFRFSASGPAQAVRVDPDGWVLKRLAGEDIP
jgi:aminopeptidase N